MPKYADLHVHSCFSDGTDTPEQIAEKAATLDIGLLAIADHNTDKAYHELHEACKKHGIRSLRAMEMDGIYEQYNLHILAYGYTPTEQLYELAHRNREILLEMSRDLIVKMEKDYPKLSLKEYDEFEYDPKSGGWKGLHYLLEKGIISELTEGMKLYGKYDCWYETYNFPPVEEVCDAIRDADGTPVLAHPANWFESCTNEELYLHFDKLHKKGIGGIECYYTSHTPEMIDACVNYCKLHDLLITAGSDHHGGFARTIRGIEYHLGAIHVPIEQLFISPLLENSWN